MGVQPGTGDPTPPGRNILVATTEPTPHAELFEAPHPAQGLVITYEHDADEWLQTNHATTDTLPASFTIVSVGDAVRSTAASPGGHATIPEPPSASPAVATIPDPTNLSNLGLTITKSLKNSDGTGTILVFDSLNGLLAGVSLHRAFRFLHLITSLVRAVNATAFYHIDPTDIEPTALETIRALFDAERGF